VCFSFAEFLWQTYRVQFITVNEFYKGLNEDISWNKHGAEEMEYSIKMLKQTTFNR
jgi:hypothetical protein